MNLAAKKLLTSRFVLCNNLVLAADEEIESSKISST